MVEVGCLCSPYWRKDNSLMALVRSSDMALCVWRGGVDSASDMYRMLIDQGIVGFAGSQIDEQFA